MHNNKKTIGGTDFHAHNASESTESDHTSDDDREIEGVAVEDLFRSYTLPSPFERDASNSMNKLFSNRERTFWVFQCVGWSGYVMVRMFQGLTMGQEMDKYFQLTVTAMIAGFALSIGMRHIYRRVRNLAIPLVLLAGLIISGSAGLILSIIETAVWPFIMQDGAGYVGIQRFGNAMFEATTLFAWTAIYFGYHYYSGFLEQQEQVLKANAMAHQAQLKMLRYQLNPHFLFNTLNAISTLVLEKATDEANGMVTKLSSFLRYTLVNQPTQKITLDQELYALGLYLDIEKVRFEDRLQIHYDIDKRVEKALIPSLILQPLIENAIKYAIAPSIDGGKLSIYANLRHHKLILQVTDDGPGVPDLNNIVSQSGTGVGLVNTKERLQQIYQAEHEFLLDNPETGGLKVTIILPLEKGE